MERHRTDVISLLFGLLFAGVGGAVLLGRLWLRDWNLWTPELWPVLLILVGLWVLVATLRRPDGSAPGDEPSQAGGEQAAPHEDEAASDADGPDALDRE